MRSPVLWLPAAVVEAGGVWALWQGLWQGWRGSRSLVWLAAGLLALAAFGFLATIRSDENFGRAFAAYGGVFVTASLGARSAGGYAAEDLSRTAGTWQVPHRA